MILDKENLFSDDEAVTVTSESENVIDLGEDHARVQDLNEKGMAELFVQATSAFAAGGAATLQVQLEQDDAVGFGSSEVVIESGDIAVADLVAGYQFKFRKLPLLSKRYIRLNYVVSTGPMTAGTVVAGLILDRQTNDI